MIRHYVKFLLQGGFINEETSPIEISIRDIKKIKIPKGTIGIELFDRVNGKKQNSEKFYIGKFIPVSDFEENSFTHFELVNSDCIGIVQCAGKNNFKIKNNEKVNILSQNEIDENNARMPTIYDDEKE